MKDDEIKRRIALFFFASGMSWLILDDYESFLAHGKPFKTIPEVITETSVAYEAEGEDLIEDWDSHLEIAAPFLMNAECIAPGFVIKPVLVKQAHGDLKRLGRLTVLS